MYYDKNSNTIYLRLYSPTCETNRYNELFTAYGGKWVFIRFNPDKYICKEKKMNPRMSTRLPELKKMIDNTIEEIDKDVYHKSNELLHIKHLYFDTT